MTNEQAAELVRRGCTPARVQEAINEDSMLALSLETMTPDFWIRDLAQRWPIQYNGGGHE